MDAMRIDKFLWAVRLYKTRSKSAEAIKGGQVFLNDSEIKAAQNVKVGDVIRVKDNPIYRSYRVKALLKSRVGAKLVENHIEECTPREELDKLEMMKMMPGFDRERGKGRPTKKERREIDKLKW